MKLVKILADIISNTLLAPKALAKAQNRKEAFTRNCGKLPYWTIGKTVTEKCQASLQ